MKKPLVLLDSGHGYDTPGKRSPVWADGKQLLEWEFNRSVVAKLRDNLNKRSIRNIILVGETQDVNLRERAERANYIVNMNEEMTVFGISIHGNAYNNSPAAQGFEAFTYHGQSQSDVIADYICKEAAARLQEHGFKMRFDTVDGDFDKEASFYILKYTKCPWVLTENGFYTNPRQCKFMMSDEGREIFAELTAEAIEKYIKDRGMDYA
jgi:N-acetylmuramoyl-L-alanine amidase